MYYQGHITLILLYIYISAIIFSLKNISSNINSTFLVHKWHVPIHWHKLVKNQCQMIMEIFTERVSLEFNATQNISKSRINSKNASIQILISNPPGTFFWGRHLIVHVFQTPNKDFFIIFL